MSQDKHRKLLEVTGLTSIADCKLTLQEGGVRVARLRKAAAALGVKNVPTSRAGVCAELQKLDTAAMSLAQPAATAKDDSESSSEEYFYEPPNPVEMAKEFDAKDDAIFTAARTRDVTALARLLTKDAKLVNARDATGKTPLMYAVLSKQLQSAKVLVHFVANVNMADDNGNTAVHHVSNNNVAQHEHRDKLSEFIIANANEDSISAKNNRGETPLYLALRSQNIAAAALLMKRGADLQSLLLQRLVTIDMLPQSLDKMTNGAASDIVNHLPREILMHNQKYLNIDNLYGEGMTCATADVSPAQWEILPLSERARSTMWLTFKQGLIDVPDCDLNSMFSKWKPLRYNSSSASASWISFADLEIPETDGWVQHVVVKLAFRSRRITRDNSMELERAVYRDVTNPLLLRGHTPHVMMCYGIVGCSDFVNKVNAIKDPFSKTKLLFDYVRQDAQNYIPDFNLTYDRTVMRALILEQSQGKTFLNKIAAWGSGKSHDKNADLAKRQISAYDELYLPVLFQLCYTLAAFEDVGLQHNDLHPSNIFVEKDPTGQQTHTYVVNGQHFQVQTQYQARIFDFDRAYKASTIANPCRLFNTMLESLCVQYGQCNQQNSRAELYRMLVGFYSENKALPDENKYLTEFIEYAIPKDLLLLRTDVGGLLKPDIPYKGSMCYCDDSNCVPCTVRTDGRIKTPRELLASDHFASYRIGKPAKDAFVWTLPSETKVEKKQANQNEDEIGAVIYSPKESLCTLSAKDGGPSVTELRNRAKLLGADKVPRSRSAVCKLLTQLEKRTQRIAPPLPAQNRRIEHTFYPNPVLTTFMTCYITQSRLAAECNMFPGGLIWDASRKQLAIMNKHETYQTVRRETIIDGWNNCYDKSVHRPTFLWSTLLLKGPDGGHANILLYHHETQTLELYDPHNDTSPEFCGEHLSEKLKELFMPKPFGIRYLVLPGFYCPRQGVQAQYERPNQFDETVDPAGFCLAWGFFRLEERIATVADVKLSHVDVHIRSKVLKIVKEQKISPTKIISNYARQLAYETFVWATKIVERELGVSVGARFRDQYIRMLVLFRKRNKIDNGTMSDKLKDDVQTEIRKIQKSLSEHIPLFMQTLRNKQLH